MKCTSYSILGLTLFASVAQGSTSLRGRNLKDFDLSFLTKLVNRNMGKSSDSSTSSSPGEPPALTTIGQGKNPGRRPPAMQPSTGKKVVPSDPALSNTDSQPPQDSVTSSPAAATIFLSGFVLSDPVAPTIPLPKRPKSTPVTPQTPAPVTLAPIELPTSDPSPSPSETPKTPDTSAPAATTSREIPSNPDTSTAAAMTPLQCPNQISQMIAEQVIGDGISMVCVTNEDCAGFDTKSDDAPCCLHPHCLCGSANPDRPGVQCVVPLSSASIPSSASSSSDPVVVPAAAAPVNKSAAPAVTPVTTPAPVTKKATTPIPAPVTTEMPASTVSVDPTSREVPSTSDTSTDAVVTTTTTTTPRLQCPNPYSQTIAQSIVGDETSIVCVTNEDCAGFDTKSDDVPCCLHPHCLCGSANTNRPGVQCVSPV